MVKAESINYRPVAVTDCQMEVGRGNNGVGLFTATSDRHSVCVVVDGLTKSAYFLSVKNTDFMLKLMQLYIR